MQPDGRIIFIVNPIAGSRQKDIILEHIRQIMARGQYEVHFSVSPGHAFEIADTMVRQGEKWIVAVGGDGTVNEVASALVNTNAHLGIVPAGSGNGLARHLGISLQVPEALAAIRNYKDQVIDAGNVNGRYFFCTFGTGFDASVGKKFSRDSRRGIRSYVRAIIHQYIKYSPKTYILKTSRKKIKLKAFLVTFANAGQYGNNAYIAPNALINDGMLDLCILRPFPKSSTITLGLRLFFKNIDQSPYLEVMQVKKARLKRKGHKKITIHIDGEPMTLKSPLKVKIVPAALHVMVPATRSRKRKILM